MTAAQASSRVCISTFVIDHSCLAQSAPKWIVEIVQNACDESSGGFYIQHNKIEIASNAESSLSMQGSPQSPTRQRSSASFWEFLWHVCWCSWSSVVAGGDYAAMQRQLSPQNPTRQINRAKHEKTQQQQQPQVQCKLPLGVQTTFRKCRNCRTWLLQGHSLDTRARSVLGQGLVLTAL